MKTDKIENIANDEALEVSINAIEPGQLFDHYLEAGFLYPEKKERLLPYFKTISAHWDALIKSKKRAVYVLTANHENGKKFASITLWENGLHSIFSQHLVSTGNPRLSLLLMIESMRTIDWDKENSRFNATQNWFRMSNRYARRVFATTHKIMGKAFSSLISFHYLMLPLNRIEAVNSNLFKVEEISEVCIELNAFIAQHVNSVFLQAEELNQEDILLTEVHKKYASCQRYRKRRILKITCTKTNEIVGCVIANRAPTGLNFSFLENRAYYIFNHGADSLKNHTMIQLANYHLQAFYKDFELKAIPIVTDGENPKTPKPQNPKTPRFL